MAEATTAYRCEFGCGHVRTKKSAVEAHEARCFRNPETRSCQTCGLRLEPERAEYDQRGTMTYPGSGWACGHDNGPTDNKPRTNCEIWEPSNG